MKSILYVAASASIFLLSANAAFADQHDTAIHGLPTSGEVTLSGTVDKTSNGRDFTLNTPNGLIVVKVPEDKIQPLKIGETVTVTGQVNKPMLGMFGNELEANNVVVTHHL